MGEKIANKLIELSLVEDRSKKEDLEEDKEDKEIIEASLIEISNKVRQIVDEVEYQKSDQVLYLNIETKKIRCEKFANDLLELVDQHNRFFFSKIPKLIRIRVVC